MRFDRLYQRVVSHREGLVRLLVHIPTETLRDLLIKANDLTDKDARGFCKDSINSAIFIRGNFPVTLDKKGESK